MGSPALSNVKFAVQLVPKVYSFDELGKIAADAKIIFIKAKVITQDETLCVLQYINEDKTAHFQVIEGTDEEGLVASQELGKAGLHVIMKTFKPSFLLVTHGSTTHLKTTCTEIIYSDKTFLNKSVVSFPKENIRIYFDYSQKIPEEMAYFFSLFR